jgi:hypothetical protein
MLLLKDLKGGIGDPIFILDLPSENMWRLGCWQA